MRIRRFGTLFIACITLLTGLAAVSAGPALGDYSPADVEPFLVTSATVATVDSAPHTQFAIACSGAVTNPTWMTDGTAPTCQGGNVTIFVTPGTKYFEEVDAAGHPCTAGPPSCNYTPSTYDQVLHPGATVRVGGSWTRQNYNSYQFYASYIWDPGTNIKDPPANPTPQTLQDRDFTERFVIDATVVENGTFLSNGLIWSDKYGFVAAKITNYSGNTQVQAIAAAHEDPSTYDPQLEITTNDAYPASTTGYMFPLTRYWVQKLDPNDGTYKFYPATKADTVVIGAPLRVAGSYAWGPDGDWRFQALMVWRPAPGAMAGQITFDETSRLTASGSSASGPSGHYDGTSACCTGQVNPATVTFDSTWGFNAQTQLYSTTGTWTAARTLGDTGTLSGSFSGTWNPANGQVQANVLLQNGGGDFCGMTGGGTFSGTALPGSPTTPAPPSTFNGSFNITTAPPPAGTTC